MVRKRGRARRERQGENDKVREGCGEMAVQGNVGSGGGVGNGEEAATLPPPTSSAPPTVDPTSPPSPFLYADRKDTSCENGALDLHTLAWPRLSPSYIRLPHPHPFLTSLLALLNLPPCKLAKRSDALSLCTLASRIPP